MLAPGIRSTVTGVVALNPNGEALNGKHEAERLAQTCQVESLKKSVMPLRCAARLWKTFATVWLAA